jgi:putative membrane protein
MKNKAFVSRSVVKIVAVAIPLAVAVMLGIRVKFDLGPWTKVLPHINAVINSLTAILLVLGLVAIKQQKREVHRKIMTSAFCLGALFLVSYILYHFTNESAHFGGTGVIKLLYYFLLISHILFSGIVVYFVLMAMYHALNEDFESHKNVVKWAYPIWMYVSVTGVLVYLMISPYYQ